MKELMLVKNTVSTLQVHWRNDPRIYRWTRQNGILSFEECEAWKAKLGKDPSMLFFGIYEVDGVPVGTMGFTSLSLIHRHAEFSLLIAPDSQRKGYGEESLKKLFRYGFHHLGLNRIWGETFDGNPAIHLFEKLGMKREGHLKQSYFKNGKFTDSFIYAILKEEAEGQAWYPPSC